VTKRDYYEILEVSPGAGADQIKKAYRRLARQYHPDRNPDNRMEAEERFKEAAEAYSVLSDPEQRARYDRFGHAGVRGAARSPRGGGVDPFGFQDLFSDFFGDLFGGTRRTGPRPEPRVRGEDLLYELEIEFEDAVKGTETRIRIPRRESCDTCGGTGAASADAWHACTQCGGSGEVIFRQGFITVARTCSRCAGRGRFLESPCADCRGQGRRRVEGEIKVRVPAGIEDGMRLRVVGAGEGGLRGGPPGDLYVVVRVAQHPLFEREGLDLKCRIPISFSQAALGTMLRVPTLDGEEDLEIPGGTQPGEVFRIRGSGAPEVGGVRRGDLLVQVEVSVPRRPSRRVREILEELERESGDEEQSSAARILERLRNLFGR